MIIERRNVKTYSEVLKHTAKTKKVFQTLQSVGLLRFNDRFQPISKR